MNSPAPLRIGLFGIGLDAYWPQFPSLKERLEGYVARVAQKLVRPGVELVNLGLVDTPDRAYAAGREFRRADVDVIFLHVHLRAVVDRPARGAAGEGAGDHPQPSRRPRSTMRLSTAWAIARA